MIAPEGTVFNPIFPAALSARHLAVQRLSDVLIEALCELLPERSVAASHVSFPALVFQAVDSRSGRLTLLADILGGGGGARRDAPGDDGIDPYCSNCAILQAEIAELEYPWRIERTELVEGSGGAGRMRGGMGLRRDYRLLADVSDGMYNVEQTVPNSRPGAARAGEPVRPERPRCSGRAPQSPHRSPARDTSTCTEATCCRWWVRAEEGSARLRREMRRRRVPRSREEP